jgi:hypothetical protein
MPGKESVLAYPDPHFIQISSILACTHVHSGALPCTRLVSQPRVKPGKPNKDARLPQDVCTATNPKATGSNPVGRAKCEGPAGG